MLAAARMVKHVKPQDVTLWSHPIIMLSTLISMMCESLVA